MPAHPPASGETRIAASTLVRPAFGALIAGGASRRFGAPKALASVAAVPMAHRACAALRAAAGEVVVIAGDAEPFARMGLRVRGDRVRGAGPLAGIHAALLWAREEGRPGALCLACDMPFVPGPLLSRILQIAIESGASAVVPESGGRTGFEPLCAYYAAGAMEAAADLLHSGERRAASLAERLGAARVPIGEVRTFGDPATLFHNVNTPHEHAEAERIAALVEGAR
ncbi:MAG TPA: molybdenum cofactor guanylyltransferase [Longimicrobiaceae bacterium]|nr:molybdenum cofactor guanylyltransferase [Longimicrobiaceae bacterium]